MTPEEFIKLSPDEQEAFLNSGGTFSSGSCSGDSVTPECVVAEDRQSGDNSSLPTTEESSVMPCTDSPQTVEILSDQSDIAYDIRDPLELVLLFDPDISSGRTKLHQWQIQFLLDFAKENATDQNPFQAVVRACNGSGKDKYCIAPCVVWLGMRYFDSRNVVTSSSGVQLDNQTCAYITLLCNAINSKYGKIWKINYRYYECLETRSQTICYATDEAGKAEGFHPFRANAKMAIHVSEDKTVPDEINVALNKCTGYTHRCHVSTPGLPLGHFYNMCSGAVNRKDIRNVNDVEPTDYIQYHVTAYDCPHIPRAYIEQMKRDLPGGEFGSAFRSQVLAEFGSTDEMVVIPYNFIWLCRQNPPVWTPEEHNQAGLDLSDGGDETVLSVRNGNKHLKTLPFRFDDTEDTVEFLEDKFVEWKLIHPKALINADCGGLGKPILDRLKRKGWSNIRYKDNRHKSIFPRTYKNFGAQSFFHIRRLFELKDIILEHADDKLIRQLSSRYYKINGDGTHQLLSKVESRARGYPSPDRADSFVLEFCDYKSPKHDDVIEKQKEAPVEKPKEVEVTPDFDLRVWARVEAGILKESKYKLSQLNDLYNVNNGQKNFSFLEDEIAEHNKRIAITK